MVPHGEQLVLNLEERVPARSDGRRSGGHVDYTAIRTSTSNAGNLLQLTIMIICLTRYFTEKFLSEPSLSLIQDNDRVFFISEAKTDNISLQDHVPRAVCEMYLRAKELKSVTFSSHSHLFM